MDPIVVVAIIGFAGQIATALIGIWMTRINHTAINDNTVMTKETHKIVNSQRTVMEARIEKLESLLDAANIREQKR